MKTVKSENHQLGCYEIKNLLLSCFDDKRYILDRQYKFICLWSLQNLKRCDVTPQLWRSTYNYSKHSPVHKCIKGNSMNI